MSVCVMLPGLVRVRNQSNKATLRGNNHDCHGGGSFYFENQLIPLFCS